jgi:hypothetical protein
MKAKQLLSALFVGLLGMAAQPALASSVTYYMDQSNALANDVNYGSVLVDDGTGDLDFTVNVIDPEGWRFSSFYFSLGGTLGDVTVNAPSQWNVDSGMNVSEFGAFTDGVYGSGAPRLKSTFTFTVASTVSLTLDNLVLNSSGYRFASQMKCATQGGNACSGAGTDSNGDPITSHWVANGVPAVPLPAAVWLFGSVLLGFGALKRKKA